MFSSSSGYDTCLNEAGTCGKSFTMSICKTPTYEYMKVFVSQMILSRITLEPDVDQLVEDYGRTSGFTYDDAIMQP